MALAKRVAWRRRLADALTGLNHSNDAVPLDSPFEHVDGDNLVKRSFAVRRSQSNRQCALNAAIGQLAF